MPLFDLPLSELEAYRPARTEPADFDAFWQRTLQAARAFPLDAKFTPAHDGLNLLAVHDVTFNGYGGQPVRGWMLLPRAAKAALPCVVKYIGYGGGRSLPADHLLWPSAGYACLVMDTRGQGGAWSPGDTPDHEPEGGNPQHPGFMTRGVLHPDTYYYRRVFTDAVRAVEAARAFELVDPARVAVTGGSQGGGIALAVAGLLPDIAAVLPDVPFLCHYRVATELTDQSPYAEIANYCRIHRDKVETVFDTLQYFDGVNFAARARCPALFSAGLMDDICPPRTVYAAYNHYAGSKRMQLWSYNRHEGGAIFQEMEKVRFLAAHWG